MENCFVDIRCVYACNRSIAVVLAELLRGLVDSLADRNRRVLISHLQTGDKTRR